MEETEKKSINFIYNNERIKNYVHNTTQVAHHLVLCRQIFS